MPRLSVTQRIAVVSLFSALAIVTDFLMLPLANVKLMDSIVFVSTLAFGPTVGISVASITWLVYGSINPLGSATGPWLVLLILSEMIYVFFGWLVSTKINSGSYRLGERSLLFGLLGLFGAFLYDLNTIVTPELLSGVSLPVTLASLPFAVPFMVSHEVSDLVFFMLIAPPLYAAVIRVGRFRLGRVMVETRSR